MNKNNCQKEVVIASAVRTPVGKFRGVLAFEDSYKLGALVIREALRRAEVQAEEVQEVVMGSLVSLPGNVARVAALEAGLPASVPAITLDRQCASGLDALIHAVAMIRCGKGEVYVAGGTESMSRAPFYLERSATPFPPSPPGFLFPQMTPPIGEVFSMGDTAENLAELYSLSREEQDQYALESHRKAAKAEAEGLFQRQILPLETRDNRGKSVPVSRDESIRPDTSLDRLAALKPVFKKDGTVTAGNSCPMNDGASALVIMSKDKALERGVPWLAEILDWEIVGLDPAVMGLGPVFAVRKLLGNNGLSLKEIGLVELNEAFAAQVLACLKELDITQERLNVTGGAISLGHPLGATGSILATKLAYLMQDRNIKYGLVTLCVGGGQGAALLLSGRE